MSNRDFDLNLLKVLIALLQEKNTSKAADILDTSQPSVSRALAKLRAELNDPLFYRERNGLKLSPKAESLAATLPMAYQTLLDTFEESVFQPENYKGKLRIAMNAYIDSIYGAKIHMHLKKQMPNLTIEILSWNERTSLQILDNQVDIALSFLPMDLHKGIYEKQISGLKFGAIVSKEHFGEPKEIDFVKTLGSHPICTVLIPEYNSQALRFEKALNIKIDALNILLRSHSITPIIDVVEQSDALFVAPYKLYERINSDKLHFIALDELADEVTTANVGIMYNYKNRTSPVFKWFEQEITKIIQQVD